MSVREVRERGVLRQVGLDLAYDLAGPVGDPVLGEVVVDRVDLPLAHVSIIGCEAALGNGPNGPFFVPSVS